MYKTILVPTDGSERAMYAVEHALDLASKYEATGLVEASVFW